MLSLLLLNMHPIFMLLGLFVFFKITVSTYYFPNLLDSTFAASIPRRAAPARWNFNREDLRAKLITGTTALGQSGLLDVCLASLACEPHLSTLVGTGLWGTRLFLLSSTKYHTVISSLTQVVGFFYPGLVTKLICTEERFPTDKMPARGFYKRLLLWNRFWIKRTFALCLDNSNVGLRGFSEQAWSSVLVLRIKRHDDIQKECGDGGEMFSTTKSGLRQGVGRDQMYREQETQVSQESPGKSPPLFFQFAGQRQRMPFLQDSTGILLCDCLQSTARLLYTLGIIKNREGCFGPEAISKVFQQSWQTLKHDRVSEIHQNVTPSLFWGGGGVVHRYQAV